MEDKDGSARERKNSKYAELVEESTGNGWRMELWIVEVVCRGSLLSQQEGGFELLLGMVWA